MRCSLIVLLAGLLVAASTPAPADVIFSDHTFNLSDYTLYSFGTDPSVTVLPPVVCVGCGTLGNTMSLTASFGAVAPGGPMRWDYSALINNTFAYDPQTQGAIANLAVSGMKELATSLYVFSGDAFAIRIQQDGKIYTYAIPGPSWEGFSSGWVSFFQSGLTADLFTEFDYATGTVGIGHPDFSGNVMYFGVGQRTGWGSPEELQVTNTWDHVTFEITSVPEPASMLLLGSGLAAAALRRKLRA